MKITTTPEYEDKKTLLLKQITFVIVAKTASKVIHFSSLVVNMYMYLAVDMIQETQNI